MPNSLFAIQVFVRIQQGITLRSDLHSVLSRAPEAATYAQKREFYQALVNVLVPWTEHFELGNWDFTDDASEAEREYESWCQGTLDDAQQSPPTPFSTGYRDPSEAYYMFVTMVFLLQTGSNDANLMAHYCNVPEFHLWNKQTFARLLRAIPMMNFVHVVSDAVYLCPGDDMRGVSTSELRSETYSYLRQLR
ncbi:MAG: hypothetical protein HY898_10120 [Deltaproteobacteria bacterium]|nr:hypothetical protein [Deltaproteobacteria bacterium]